MHSRYNPYGDYSFPRVDKSEIVSLRRSKMTQGERLREKFSIILKNMLMFGIPVLLSVLMMIVLVMIYLIHPYSKVRNFTQTVCTVTRIDILNSTASCSAGTDPFQPCVKLYVSYHNGSTADVNYAVLMENEQALVYCNPCSYTFGSYGLLHKPQPCETWREDFNPLICVQNFLQMSGAIGTSFVCYFNPDNTKQVVRELVVGTNDVAHAVIWPTLFCVVYILGCVFVSYNNKQIQILDKLVLNDLREKERMQEIARIQASEWKKQRMSETLEVKKQLQNKLGTALGARVINHSNGTLDRNTKRISCSLPSLHSAMGEANPAIDETETIATESIESIADIAIEAVEDDPFDLRHLDLAVSAQNINDLTTTYAYLATPPPCSDTGVAISNSTDCRTLPRGYNQKISHSKWKILTKDGCSSGSFNSGSLKELPAFNNTNRDRYSTFNTNNNNKTVHAPQTSSTLPLTQSSGGCVNTALSEDDIDYYYKVIQKKILHKNEKKTSNSNGSTIIFHHGKSESMV